MKKIILLLILFFNIIPKMDDRHHLTLIQVDGLKAQDIEDMGEVCDVFPELCDGIEPVGDPTVTEGGINTDPSYEADIPCGCIADDWGNATNDNGDYGYSAGDVEGNDPMLNGDSPNTDDPDYWDWVYSLGLNKQGDPDNPQYPEAPQYYILLNNDAKHYFDGDKLYYTIHPGVKPRFWIKSDNVPLGPTDIAGLHWKINNLAACIGTDTCHGDLTKPGTFNVMVYDNNGTRLIFVTITVYPKPVIKFNKKVTYHGDYGFDDTGYTYDSLKSNYETLIIDTTTTYAVPWMSLLDGQSDTVNINSILSQQAVSDANFYVQFRPTSPDIKINGYAIPMQQSGSQLSTLKSIVVTANELDADITHHTQAAIVVVNNLGDTVGKLNISCQKPVNKKMVLVYVKTDPTGYRNGVYSSISKDSILNQLNKYSHNQIFKKWVLETGYPDTLDLTYEYTTNPGYLGFKNQPNIMNNYYQKHKGISVVGLNYDAVLNKSYTGSADTNKVHFVYITNFNYFKDSLRDSTIAGITPVGGFASTIFKHGQPSTMTHELGHILTLEHTFYDPKFPTLYFCPHIPEYTTLNFMDYGQYSNSPSRNFFFYYQWIRSL